MEAAMSSTTINPDSSLGEIAQVQVENQSEGESRGSMEAQRPDAAEPPSLTIVQKKKPIDFVKKMARILASSICEIHFLRYTIYAVMSFSAFAVIIAGMTSRHEEGWGLAFIASYACWTFAASLCVYHDLKQDAFVKHAASHLACCGITLYFFAAALNISSTDLPMYLPMGVNIGLLLSFGLQQISLPTKMQLLSCLGLGYSYEALQQPPILPLVEPRAPQRRPRLDDVAS